MRHAGFVEGQRRQGKCCETRDLATNEALIGFTTTLQKYNGTKRDIACVEIVRGEVTQCGVDGEDSHRGSLRRLCWPTPPCQSNVAELTTALIHRALLLVRSHN